MEKIIKIEWEPKNKKKVPCVLCVCLFNVVCVCDVVGVDVGCVMCFVVYTIRFGSKVWNENEKNPSGSFRSMEIYTNTHTQPAFYLVMIIVMVVVVIMVVVVVVVWNWFGPFVKKNFGKSTHALK